MSRSRHSWQVQPGVTTDDLLTQLYGERRRRTDRLACYEGVITVEESRSRLWRGIGVALALELVAVLALMLGAVIWRGAGW